MVKGERDKNIDDMEFRELGTCWLTRGVTDCIISDG